MEDLVLMTMTMDIEGDHHKPHNYLRIITNLIILSQDDHKSRNTISGSSKTSLLSQYHHKPRNYLRIRTLSPGSLLHSLRVVDVSSNSIQVNAVVFAHSYNDDVQERKDTMSSFYLFVSIQVYVVFTSCGDVFFTKITMILLTATK